MRLIRMRRGGGGAVVNNNKEEDECEDVMYKDKKKPEDIYNKCE